MQLFDLISLKTTNKLKKLRNYLPSKLPVGTLELEAFIKDIIDTYDFPNLPSYSETIAKMILHTGELNHTRPKVYFYKALRSAQAREIAWNYLQVLKEKEKAIKLQSEVTLEASPQELADVVQPAPNQDPTIAVVQNT